MSFSFGGPRSNAGTTGERKVEQGGVDELTEWLASLPPSLVGEDDYIRGELRSLETSTVPSVALYVHPGKGEGYDDSAYAEPFETLSPLPDTASVREQDRRLDDLEERDLYFRAAKQISSEPEDSFILYDLELNILEYFVVDLPEDGKRKHATYSVLGRVFSGTNSIIRAAKEMRKFRFNPFVYKQLHKDAIGELGHITSYPTMLAASSNLARAFPSALLISLILRPGFDYHSGASESISYDGRRENWIKQLRNRISPGTEPAATPGECKIVYSFDHGRVSDDGVSFVEDLPDVERSLMHFMHPDGMTAREMEDMYLEARSLRVLRHYSPSLNQYEVGDSAPIAHVSDHPADIDPALYRGKQLPRLAEAKIPIEAYSNISLLQPPPPPVSAIGEDGNLRLLNDQRFNVNSLFMDRARVGLHVSVTDAIDKLIELCKTYIPRTEPYVSKRKHEELSEHASVDFKSRASLPWPHWTFPGGRRVWSDPNGSPEPEQYEWARANEKYTMSSYFLSTHVRTGQRPAFPDECRMRKIKDIFNKCYKHGEWPWRREVPNIMTVCSSGVMVQMYPITRHYVSANFPGNRVPLRSLYLLEETRQPSDETSYLVAMHQASRAETGQRTARFRCIFNRMPGEEGPYVPLHPDRADWYFLSGIINGSGLINTATAGRSFNEFGELFGVSGKDIDFWSLPQKPASLKQHVMDMRNTGRTRHLLPYDMVHVPNLIEQIRSHVKYNPNTDAYVIDNPFNEHKEYPRTRSFVGVMALIQTLRQQECARLCRLLLDKMFLGDGYDVGAPWTRAWEYIDPMRKQNEAVPEPDMAELFRLFVLVEPSKRSHSTQSGEHRTNLAPMKNFNELRYWLDERSRFPGETRVLVPSAFIRIAGEATEDDILQIATQIDEYRNSGLSPEGKQDLVVALLACDNRLFTSSACLAQSKLDGTSNRINILDEIFDWAMQLIQYVHTPTIPFVDRGQDVNGLGFEMPPVHMQPRAFVNPMTGDTEHWPRFVGRSPDGPSLVPRGYVMGINRLAEQIVLGLRLQFEYIGLYKLLFGTNPGSVPDDMLSSLVSLISPCHEATFNRIHMFRVVPSRVFEIAQEPAQRVADEFALCRRNNDVVYSQHALNRLFTSTRDRMIGEYVLFAINSVARKRSSTENKSCDVDLHLPKSSARLGVGPKRPAPFGSSSSSSSVNADSRYVDPDELVFDPKRNEFVHPRTRESYIERTNSGVRRGNEPPVERKSRLDETLSRYLGSVSISATNSQLGTRASPIILDSDDVEMNEPVLRAIGQDGTDVDDEGYVSTITNRSVTNRSVLRKQRGK